MLDFTSALYLGLRHPSAALRPWVTLSEGRPAALGDPPGASRVAAELAALIDRPRALLLPSTLHLFLDLFEVLAAEPITIHLDDQSYPVARWAVERLAGRVPIGLFRHHDPAALQRSLGRRGKRRPVVLVDGFCPLCGGAAPLAEYAATVRRAGGLLVVDDSQALGILGEAPSPERPYGSGGGGSLRWSAVQGPDIVVAASLAKGFGVPVAVLAGSASLIDRFAAGSLTRVHCSPPSIAAIHAAEAALTRNRYQGEQLRLRLIARVRRFRRGLGRYGLVAEGGLFPVQGLGAVRGLHPLTLHRLLRVRGIRSVPLGRRGHGGPRLAFLLSASHSLAEIDQCLAVLGAIIDSVPNARCSGSRRLWQRGLRSRTEADPNPDRGVAIALNGDSAAIGRARPSHSF